MGMGARVRVQRDPKQGHRDREKDGKGRNTHRRDGRGRGDGERGEEIAESVSIHRKGADTGKGKDRIRRQVVPTKSPHPAYPPLYSPSPRSPGLRPKGSSWRGGMVGGRGRGGGSSWWRGLRRGEIGTWCREVEEIPWDLVIRAHCVAQAALSLTVAQAGPEHTI